MATTGEKATGTITIEYNTVTVTPGADGDVWLTPSEIARMVRGVRPGDYEQYTGDLQARRTAYVGNLESSDGTCRTV